MPETIYSSKVYRLRAGNPMPTQEGGRFVLHTFMAEVNDIDIIACTESLPGSEQFRGQGGDYMSANFSRLATKGGGVFSGRIVRNPDYVDEDSING
jgi:hypothetical protein